MAKPKSIRESLPAFQRLLHHCRPELRKQRWVISGSVVALLSEVLFRVLEPWPLKFVFDRLLRRNGEGPTGARLVRLGPAVAIPASENVTASRPARSAPAAHSTVAHGHPR